jgi:two-component system cell cycle sensor histidine kinase/response regulator CckA
MKSPETSSSEKTGKPKMILLVEDSSDIRELATSTLRSADFEVVEACNAEQALEILAQIPGGPDLLITDLMLPGLNGTELANRVWALHPHVRVLYTTGYGAESVEVDPATGMASHLQKPFSLRALRQRVREMLDIPPAH